MYFCDSYNWGFPLQVVHCTDITVTLIQLIIMSYDSITKLIEPIPYRLNGQVDDSQMLLSFPIVK